MWVSTSIEQRPNPFNKFWKLNVESVKQFLSPFSIDTAIYSGSQIQNNFHDDIEISDVALGALNVYHVILKTQ